ncbi:hypothetical protein L3Q82_004411 [Scortum barcoo]|uniref:Uncharacterized protein n=1 Tax=Scortum barcoo TaxID=214431 RepID=A0ACB8VK25_9TELE|nr:hypothetical protein L3Q82_004411 [Scortum barcoo]
MSCVVPVPKTLRPKKPNHFRPVVLMTHLIKALERIVLRHLRPLALSRGPTLVPGPGLGLQAQRLVAGSLPVGPVGLTSTHSLGSGTQLLERGWTVHYSRVVQSEQWQAGVGLLIAPQLSRHVLEFILVNGEGRFPAPSGLVRDKVSCCCLCLHGPEQQCTEYPPSWSPWDGAGT